MQKIIYTLLFILITLSCQNQKTEQQKADTHGDIEATKIEISVEGMTCTGCEQTVQESIKKLDGIKSAKASHLEGSAVIEYFDNKVDTAEIINAINKTGYAAKEIKMVNDSTATEV